MTRRWLGVRASGHDWGISAKLVVCVFCEVCASAEPPFDVRFEAI